MDVPQLVALSLWESDELDTPVREQVFSNKEMNPLTEEDQQAFDANHCCPVCEVSFDATR